MMKLAISPAAASLLRGLLNRAGVERTRILLGDFKSTDWQSLTFIGERHEIELRVPGPAADLVVDRLQQGLADAEFDIAGHIVADIRPVGPPVTNRDGSVSLVIEALTIAE